MTNYTILQKIQEQKQIWKKSIPFFFRDVFPKIEQSLKKENITILSGLRRVGKTTILLQLMQKLHKAGIADDTILFFSFDEMITRNIDFLDQLLKTFLSDINDENRYYIFLDEIQYIDFWQGTIKKYFELYPQVKFVLSGSASLFLKEKIADSLTGRTYEVEIEPLNFYEYLALFKGEKLTPPKGEIIKSFLLRPTSQTFDTLIQEAAELQTMFETEFIPYLFHGEFPEINKYESLQEKYSYINESIYKKLLEYDLPEVFNIRNKAEFIRLYEILIKETGNYFEIQNFARETGISKDTLKHYLHVFKKGFLLGSLFSFSKSLRKQGRNLEKHYIGSPNFYAAHFHLPLTSAGITEILGHLLETKIFWRLKNYFTYQFFYYYQKEEVDFLVSDDPLLKHLIPIEIKCKKNIDNKDLKAMLQLLNKRKIQDGFLISLEANHHQISGNNVWELPASLFI